jgi:N-acetylneuraminic acid mutarotase
MRTPRSLSAALVLGGVLCECGGNSTTHGQPSKATESRVEQSEPAATPPPDCTPTGMWRTRKPMNLPAVFAGTVAVPDGRIFVISGFAPYGRPRRLTNAVRVYDPSKDAWAEASPIPTARGSPAAAVGPDGKIYVVGGVDPDSKNNVVEAYDPKTDSWARLKPLPTKRDDGLCAVAAKGADGRVRIYTIGGRDDSKPGNGLSTVEAYDPATDTWSARAPMPTHRHALAATRGPDGRIYAVGGTNDRVFSTDVLEIYDPARDAWAPGAPMPYGQECAAATFTPGPAGEVLVLGGWDTRHQPLRSAVAYNPRTDTWRSLPGVPTARAAAGAVTIEGADGCLRVYVLGGTYGWTKAQRDNGRQDVVEVYCFRPASHGR